MNSILLHPSGLWSPCRIIRFAALGAVFALATSLNAATYYVDSANGNDAADGQSETTAWKTNGRVNQTVYQPGDRILYKRGGVYTGHLHPSGSGVAGSPITLSAYGDGARPIIDGEGNSMPVGSTSAYLYMDINVNYGGSAISFRSQEYWEISGIAVRNKGATEAIRRGLFISLGGATYRGWKIRDCAFHDINGWNQDEVQQGKSLSGVTLLTTGTTEGFLLEDNEFYGIAGGAMWIACGKGGGVENKPYWGAGLVVRGNVIRDIGTMGMLITRAKDPLIEHNVAYRCHKRTAAGGLWNANTEGAVFQFNEWYDDGKDGQDGTAFDPDVYTTKTTVQYNYVHDAQGLVCFYTDEQPVDPDIIRYNVCVNLHTGGSGIIRFKSNHPIHVYNNTFYITSYAASGGKKAFEGFSGLASQDHRFYNNLVFLAPTASNFAYGDGLRNAPASKVSHNCFAGEQVGSVPVGDTVNTLRGVDPLLVSPGPSNPGFATCVNYQLQAGSPCIDAGKVIAGNGGRDFFGNPLADGSPDIGVHEFTPVNEPPIVDAGADQTITLPASANLDGSVTDDGAFSVQWSLASGPGSVVFGDPNAIDTTATFGAAGVYVLTLTADDGVNAPVSDSATVTVNPAAPVTETNVALNGTISAYSKQDTQNPAVRLIDGKVDTRWAAPGYPQWVEIDLGQNCTVSRSVLKALANRDYQYRIEGKLAGGAYATLVDRTANTAPTPHQNTFASTVVRFVKITVTGADDYAGDWVNLCELEIYGYPSN